MNRRSLFGRFAVPLSADRTANRLEHRRVHMEPLEVRQVLATIYVNDNWVSADPGAGNLTQGDTVFSSADPLNNTITASYGDNAFGKVSNATSSTGNPYLTVAGQGLSTQFIDDAIGAANDGDTVSLVEGTYTESDIVIDKAVLFKGSGTSGSGDTVIVPEVVSASVENEFPTASHQGIIIYSPSVTVTNVHINGSGNNALAGSLNFHQGITTLYDTQDGVNGVGGTRLRSGPRTEHAGHQPGRPGRPTPFRAAPVDQQRQGRQRLVQGHHPLCRRRLQLWPHRLRRTKTRFRTRSSTASATLAISPPTTSASWSRTSTIRTTPWAMPSATRSATCSASAWRRTLTAPARGIAARLPATTRPCRSTRSTTPAWKVSATTSSRAVTSLPTSPTSAAAIRQSAFTRSIRTSPTRPSPAMVRRSV